MHILDGNRIFIKRFKFYINNLNTHPYTVRRGGKNERLGWSGWSRGGEGEEGIFCYS